MYPKEIKSTKDRLDYAVAMGKKIKEEEEKKKKDTLYQQAYKELSQPKQTIQPTQDEYQQAYNEVFMEYSNPEKTRRDYIPTLNTTSDKQVNNVGDALSHLGQKAIYGLAGGVSNITGGIAKTLGNPGTAIDAVLDIPESFHNAFLKNTYKVMDKENPGYYDDLSEKDKIKHDSLFNQTKTENFLDRNIDQYDDFMNWLDNNPVSNVLDSVGDGYLNSNNYFRSNYNEEDMNKILKFGGDIVQGVGNMFPSIAIGAVTGNPSLAMGTMGVNAYGGGLHQALMEGADLENAYRYGLANALTEVATESLVGGIPALGGGYADDLITKVTDKAFKTPTAKNIANKGLDLLGEGLEEYLGDVIGEFTTDIYSNEKQYEDPMQRLKDAQADALYSGLVGIGTAGLLNAPGYISEVNANRQNNASTDTIQSNILENNTLAKEPVNSEIEQAVTELEEEFYQPKQYELTQEQLDNSPFSLEELQSGGSEIIITKNELLNDNALIRDNAQKVNTQNIEIQLENSNYDKQTVATLSKLSNEYGIPLKFDNLPSHINGMYYNGEIVINKNSSDPLVTVFTHELTHSLESTQTYSELVDSVIHHLEVTSDISDLNAVIDEEVYRVIKEREELGINLNYDQAHKEVIAEYISEYIADDSFINSISSNKSIVQRIVDWLKNIVTSLTGSKEQKAYKGLLNKYQKALTQYSINPTNNSDIRFSPKKEIKNNIITLNKEIPGLREKLINNSNKYLGYESTEFKNLLKNGARDILETGNITESSRNSIYDYIENNSKIGLTQDINNFVSEIKATIDNKKALIKRANKDENIIEKTTDKVHKILKTGKDLETKYSKDMERYVNEYGAIKKGEMPARNIKVPKETDKGTVKQHYRTILESPQASIEVIEALQGEIDNGNATYKPISNETLVNNSKNTDAQIGSKHMYDEFMRNDKISAQAISDGEYLLNKAMRNNNIEQTINLSQKLASMLNETGRALQSARILKRLTPEGQLTILQKEVIKINNEIETKFKNKKPVKISDELVKKFTEADTIEGKKEVLTEMQKNVGQQIPSSFADKMNQWRYLSMLGNPRTHIRNIVGNTMFQPIVGAKNVIGTIIEGTISKTGLIKDLERSKAILNPLSKQDSTLIKWANDDFKNVKVSFENTGKYEISKEIQSNKKVFESKIVGETLNKLSDWNSKMLDYEDEVFTKYRYSRTLAEQFKANKVTPETVDSDTLVKFQDKAYKEALESVYRDANGLANWINKGRYTSKGAKFLLDAIIPFTKTPMNIVKRMVEYSPVGLVKDITLGVYEVQQGKISADTYINNLSKGLTGTGIAMLGYFLASIGMFRTSDDDKDRLNAFERDLGEQNYALVLPNGDTYTLDWMSPVIGPLGIGAELFKYVEDKSTTKNIGDIYDRLLGVIDPIMQTSMMSGLANSLSSYGDKKIGDIFESAVYSYVGQFFPTFGGQLARVFDDKRRTTYSNNPLERQVKIIMNKIPGVATLNEPYINKKGQEEYTGNILERVFNNMISPGYYKKNTADKYDKELIRLYNKNPELDKYQSTVPTSYSNFAYNSTNYKFTPKEATQVNSLYGTTVRKEVSNFIDSSVYKNLSDDERVDIISQLQTYAVQMTKIDYFNTENAAKDDKNFLYANYFKKKGYNIYSYYINKSIPSVIDENGETIRNSQAVLARFNLERLGIYDSIVQDYQNGKISDKELKKFNLNKTVVNMETYKYYNKFEEYIQHKEVVKTLSDFDIFESTVMKYKK